MNQMVVVSVHIFLSGLLGPICIQVSIYFSYQAKVSGLLRHILSNLKYTLNIALSKYGFDMYKKGSVVSQQLGKCHLWTLYYINQSALGVKPTEPFIPSEIIYIFRASGLAIQSAKQQRRAKHANPLDHCSIFGKFWCRCIVEQGGSFFVKQAGNFFIEQG